MDINKIIAVIEGKEECTKDTLKEIRKVINDFPYFQTGHMLMLKALHSTDKEKYNEQLKISGVFISNKIKLFKFINHTAQELKLAAEQKEVIPQKKEINKSVSIAEIKKETTSKTSLPEKQKKVTSTIKENLVKDIKAEQKVNYKEQIKNIPEQKQVGTKITEIKKERKVPVNVADDEIYEKSKQQHKRIVKDFFVDPDKKVIIIDETTKQEDIKKLINIPEKNIKEKTVKVSRVEKIRKIAEPEKEQETISKTNLRNKTEVKKDDLPIKNEKKEILDKKEEIKQTTKPPVQEKSVKTEKGPKKQADVMNEIFSKIRAIKKEMNIATDEHKETIEIKPERKEKKHRIVDKVDDLSKKNEILEKKEVALNHEKKEIKEQNIEKEQIKEQIIKESQKENEEKEDRELTAWDLVKQHQKNKFKKTDVVPSGKSKIEEYLEKQTNNEKKIEQNDFKEEKIEIEKKQEVVAENKNEKIADKKKEEDTAKKEETKIPENKENESAADALLRRIAMKKQQLKEKKENIEDKEENIESEDESADSFKEKQNEFNEEQIEKTVEIKEKAEEKQKESIVKEEKQEKKKVKKTQKLIEEFINKADSLERIKPDKEPSIKGDISVKSTIEKEDFITEAMADLYVQQKYYQKAIDAYKKLILKFPQKKTYFAIQIKKVESLIKK